MIIDGAIAKRTLCTVAAVAAVGLVGTACSSDDDSTAASSETMSTMASDDMAGMTGMSGESTTAMATPTNITTSTPLTTADGANITIDNEAIAASYGERGGPQGYLGKPLGPVVTLPTGGSFITLQNGSLYQNPQSGKVFAVHGMIGDAWGEHNHENGELGYPTSDETRTDGGLRQTYDHGTITFINGRVTVTPS
ncbi:LGFP repeat-containing protein [Gordonia sp. NPDC003504]